MRNKGPIPFSKGIPGLPAGVRAVMIEKPSGPGGKVRQARIVFEAADGSDEVQFRLELEGVQPGQLSPAARKNSAFGLAARAFTFLKTTLEKPEGEPAEKSDAPADPAAAELGRVPVMPSGE
jgi:hypothetical protein